MKVIINTHVIKEDGMLFDGIVALEGDKIVAVKKQSEFIIPEGAEIIDAKGLYTAPGLIDIHNHGSQKEFFMDNPKDCCEHFIKHGQTSVLPTLYSTYTKEQMIEGSNKLKDFSKNAKLGKMIKGLYMEGPYMMAGGSNQKYIKWAGPIVKEEYQELVDELKGFAKIWAIDPDRENVDEFMKYVKSVDDKAIFALGHSRARASQCEKVYHLGVKLQTHHGDSGTGPKLNQAKNDAGCDEFTLCHPDMYAEIICDQNAVHLGAYSIRVAVNVKGVEKIILITDCYPGTGDYKNNEEEGIMYGPDLNYDYEGHLAGSHLTLDNAVRNMMVHTGYGLVHAIRFASINPATLLGINDKYGSIKEGKVADIILIDGAVRVKKVFLAGEEVDV